MTTTNETELSAACEHIEARFGEDAICGQPIVLEAIYQARRLLRVLALGMKPDRELALALASASERVYEAAKYAPVWHRYWVAAERAAADLLRVAPTRTTPVKESKSYGYDGTACTDCGQFTVRVVGTCRGCTSCGWSGGCG